MRAAVPYHLFLGVKLENLNKSNNDCQDKDQQIIDASSLSISLISKYMKTWAKYYMEPTANWIVIAFDNSWYAWWDSFWH